MTLGYSEGQNLIFDLRSAHGDKERLLKRAAELVRTEPEVTVAVFWNGHRQGSTGVNRDDTDSRCRPQLNREWKS